jgi:hypothetical protein
MYLNRGRTEKIKNRAATIILGSKQKDSWEFIEQNSL